MVAGFVTIIVFPMGRILASAIHSHWNQSRERNRSMDQSTTTRKAGGLMKAPRRGLHRAEGG